MWLCCCQAHWIPKLTLMGYTNPLHLPMNLVVQATMALEVHKLVDTTDLKMLSHDDTDLGPLVLDTLGIGEWSSIYHNAEKRWNS